jgi:hypothetical protein
MVHTMKNRLGRNVVLCVLFCSFFTVSCHLQDNGRTGPFAAVQTTVYLNRTQPDASSPSSQKECITLLQHTAAIPIQSVIHAHQGALLDGIDAAQEYNQEGDVHKADTRGHLL